MEALTALYGFYIVPASVLFGGTIVVVVFTKKPQLFQVEYFSWLLPGNTYWFLSEPLHLEQAFRGKSLANLIEPALVAVTSWLFFVARLIIAARAPRFGRTSAFCCIGLSNLAAFCVLALMPLLPE